MEIMNLNNFGMINALSLELKRLHILTENKVCFARLVLPVQIPLPVLIFVPMVVYPYQNPLVCTLTCTGSYPYLYRFIPVPLPLIPDQY